jgi:general secretion pathway protein I
MQNSNHRVKHSRHNGFTLIEVLVALMVIAIALSAVIRATAVMVGNTAHLKEKTYAHWIAMNRVAELRVTRAWPEIGNSSDDVEMFGEEWRWMQQVSQLAISENMRQVEISVIHRDGNEAYPLTKLTAFLLEPVMISQTTLESLYKQTPNDPNDPDPNNPDPNNPDPNNPDPNELDPNLPQ